MYLLVGLAMCISALNVSVEFQIRGQIVATELSTCLSTGCIPAFHIDLSWAKSTAMSKSTPLKIAVFQHNKQYKGCQLNPKCHHRKLMYCTAFVLQLDRKRVLVWCWTGMLDGIHVFHVNISFIKLWPTLYNHSPNSCQTLKGWPIYLLCFQELNERIESHVCMLNVKLEPEVN